MLHRNGRGYDDSTWLHIDTRLPHSGSHCGRIFLPTGKLTYVPIPCEGTGKHDPVCTHAHALTCFYAAHTDLL
jgi:hypothetical protein